MYAWKQVKLQEQIRHAFEGRWARPEEAPMMLDLQAEGVSADKDGISSDSDMAAFNDVPMDGYTALPVDM